MQWTAREIGAASSIDLAGYGEGEWRWTHQAELRDAYGYLDRWAVAVADRRTRRGDTIAELAAREGLLALPATAFPAQLEVQRVVGARRSSRSRATTTASR